MYNSGIYCSTLSSCYMYTHMYMCVYTYFCFLAGYVQGMSDLLAPLLAVMENEVDTFWCFVGFMDTVVSRLGYLVLINGPLQGGGEIPATNRTAPA